MTTRRVSRLINLLAILAVFVVFVLTGSPASAGRGDRTAPTAPTNLQVTSITETTVTLVWNPSTDNSGKFSYRLKITNQRNSAYNSLATISQTQTTYTAKCLAALRRVESLHVGAPRNVLLWNTHGGNDLRAHVLPDWRERCPIALPPALLDGE